MSVLDDIVRAKRAEIGRLHPWRGALRKQAEDALRESEARFSNAFEFAPIGIALVSLEGKWLKVNRSLCDLLGYTAPAVPFDSPVPP